MPRRGVVQRRRDRTLHIDHEIVTELIEFAGGNPRLDVWGNEIEHFGRKAACDAHFFDVLRGFDNGVHEFNSGKACERFAKGEYSKWGLATATQVACFPSRSSCFRRCGL